MYAQPVSTLARELISLRTGRKARRGGRRPPPAPRIREPRYIDERPAEVEGQAVPGHWEGDLERHEALCIRVEVKDLRRCVVAAA